MVVSALAVCGQTPPPSPPPGPTQNAAAFCVGTRPQGEGGSSVGGAAAVVMGCRQGSSALSSVAPQSSPAPRMAASWPMPLSVVKRWLSCRVMRCCCSAGWWLRSCRMAPGSTAASWSASPSRMRRVSAAVAAMSACASSSESIEASSMMMMSCGSGRLAWYCASPLLSMPSRRCRVCAGRPLMPAAARLSSMRFAALPVGAARAMRMSAAVSCSARMRRAMV